MKHIYHFPLFFLSCFVIFSCTEDGDGRIIVTTGTINMNETVINNNMVASASGTVAIQGVLPEGYVIDGAGIIYGVDSTELRVSSCQSYGGTGWYDSYYGCFRYNKYIAMGRSMVVSVRITDTVFNDAGDIYCFDYMDIYGGECEYVCPLINLPRGSKLFLRAFAHISNGEGDDRYVYGLIKDFLTPGIHQDPSVFIEIDALGIAVSKMDVEVATGYDAQRYCSNINFYEPLGGYSDWRVPTLNELEEIYKLRNAIGGFMAAKYFSCQLWGEDIFYWYWDFATNSAGHEETSGYSSQHGRLRLVRDI